MITPLYTLLLVIFLEGYVVLSSELLAIRLAVPFVGSGTDTISIIIAAVLMPLAFGYAAGGKFRVTYKDGQTAQTVRKQLLWNLTVAAMFLTPGLSYLFINWGYNKLYDLTGLNDRISYTIIYSALFLVYPVFLLGQTVPLVSNFFHRQRLSSFAGKILFFSTMGSFMGAILCTLIFMAYFGVHHSVSITLFYLFFIALLLSKKKTGPAPFITGFCLLLSLFVNSDAAMCTLHVVKNDQYNILQITEKEGGSVRQMLLNRSMASQIYAYTHEAYPGYIYYIDQNFIQPSLQDKNMSPLNILVLGAGGFALGREDDKNHYTFVDIDKHLKEISEKDFLKEKLGSNKKFVPLPARGFLMQDKQKYDLIVVDLFIDPTSTPDHLITREFFEQVKTHLKDGGAMVANSFGSPTFSDPFSRNLYSTMQSVFPYLNRAMVEDFNGEDRSGAWQNVMFSYIYHKEAEANGTVIYTDDKNSAMYDRPAKLPPRAKHNPNEPPQD